MNAEKRTLKQESRAAILAIAAKHFAEEIAVVQNAVPKLVVAYSDFLRWYEGEDSILNSMYLQPDATPSSSYGVRPPPRASPPAPSKYASFGEVMLLAKDMKLEKREGGRMREYLLKHELIGQYEKTYAGLQKIDHNDMTEHKKGVLAVVNG